MASLWVVYRWPELTLRAVQEVVVPTAAAAAEGVRTADADSMEEGECG